MTEVLKICSGAIIAAVCGILLRELGWRGAAVFSIISLSVFFGVFADALSGLTKEILSVSELGVALAVKEILKVIGVSYLFGFCADICAELGERGLSGVLLAVGRVEILVIVTPYMLDMIRLAAELV